MSDYHGFDCYRYKEFGKNMGDRLSRSWLLEMVPNSLRPREIVGKIGIRKNVRNVFTYHWWTRQTSISAFFIIQQVNFILSLYDHRRFMVLDWTWVSICTYNILWNREQIAFESNQDMITFFYGENLLPKIKIFSKDRRFSPYTFADVRQLIWSSCNSISRQKMKLHQPILLLTDLVRDNIITRIEFKNTIMHYRSYITKTHGQRIKCCTSKVKNTLILLKIAVISLL